MSDTQGDPAGEAEALLAAATPGPWIGDSTHGDITIITEDGEFLSLFNASSWSCEADTELIAASPRLLRSLLDENQRLRQAIERIHVPIPEDPNFCSACTTSWPCETYRLVAPVSPAPKDVTP